MNHERRKELLKVVLMQIEKGNKIPSAILACSSDSEERKHVTRALEACIPITSDGRRAADKAADYEKALRSAGQPRIVLTWIRRAIKNAQTRIAKEKELARLK